MGRTSKNQASLFLLQGARSVDGKEVKRRKDGFLRLKLVLFVNLNTRDMGIEYPGSPIIYVTGSCTNGNVFGMHHGAINQHILTSCAAAKLSKVETTSI